MTQTAPPDAPTSALLRSVESLAGVGPTRAKHFAALGVSTLGDLLEYFPRDYQYESEELKISQLRPEQIQMARGAEVGEWFDEALLKRRGLLGRREAYRQIHRPPDTKSALAARRRIIYEELMLMQLGLGLSKRLRDGRLTAPVMRIDKLLDERIRKRFPFQLTQAQQNAIWQIVHDLRSGRPMNRLLQGDVGSGKTVVALYAMLVAVANKMQAAILAPTEVLAEQHFLTLSRLLEGSSVRIELFTQRTKRESKGKLPKELARGNVHLA